MSIYRAKSIISNWSLDVLATLSTAHKIFCCKTSVRSWQRTTWLKHLAISCHADWSCYMYAHQVNSLEWRRAGEGEGMLMDVVQGEGVRVKGEAEQEGWSEVDRQGGTISWRWAIVPLWYLAGDGYTRVCICIHVYNTEVRCVCTLVCWLKGSPNVCLLVHHHSLLCPAHC